MMPPPETGLLIVGVHSWHILQDFTTSLVNMTEMNSEDCLNDPTQDQTSESFEAKDEIDPSVAELNRFVASVASNMPRQS